MKKKFIVIFLILFSFTFCSCSNDTINNKETGKVKDYEYEQKYKNGTYYAYSKYFNDSNEYPVLLVRVKNKIITKVRFYYVNSKYEVVKNLANEQFLIDNLNTLVLQNQGKIKYELEQEDLRFILSDYNVLLNSVISMMKGEEDKSSHIVDIDYEYSSKSKMDNFGYISELKVSYANEFISDVKFMQTNSIGEGRDSHYIEEFASKNSIEYEDYIKSISALSIGKRKVVQVKDVFSEVRVYNELAKEINNKRKKVKRDIIKDKK